MDLIYDQERELSIKNIGSFNVYETAAGQTDHAVVGNVFELPCEDVTL